MMTSKERVCAAIDHKAPDRVPTGENAVDYELVEQILGHPTLYNSRWRERCALWDGRRDEIAAEYGAAHVELVRALEWDYVRVPVVPADRQYRRPEMTGPYSWLDEEGNEIEYFPDTGNIATFVAKEDMTIEQGIALSIQALKKALGEGFKESRLDGAYITIKDKIFKRLTKEQITKALIK